MMEKLVIACEGQHDREFIKKLIQTCNKNFDRIKIEEFINNGKKYENKNNETNKLRTFTKCHNNYYLDNNILIKEERGKSVVLLLIKNIIHILLSNRNLKFFVFFDHDAKSKGKDNEKHIYVELFSISNDIKTKFPNTTTSMAINHLISGIVYEYEMEIETEMGSIKIIFYAFNSSLEEAINYDKNLQNLDTRIEDFLAVYANNFKKSKFADEIKNL